MPDERLPPEKLKAVLAGVTCPRMMRAWRNRSLVTQNRWRNYGRTLVGNATGSNWHEYDKLGRCLYATCGAFTLGFTFVADAKWIDWNDFGDVLWRNTKVVPNLAWTRADYEDYRDHFFPKRG